MPEPADWLPRLEADGLVRRDAARLRTTRRWQAAMARAALRMYRDGDGGDDLRVPIAAALIEVYGVDLDDESLVAAIAAMLPVELDELSPR